MPEKLTYFVLNIKLQTNKNGQERTDAYIKLVQNLVSKPYRFYETSKNEGIMMYGSQISKSPTSTYYLYGRAAKGFYIPGTERKVLKDGVVNIELNNPELLINPEIVRYLFIPSAHRLFVEKKNNGPSQFEMEKYLRKELESLIDSEDILQVILEKDESTIKEIFDAKIVHSISYKVSYTNEDFTKDLAEDLERELKEDNIGELSVTAKADNKIEGLKIERSKILGGGLKLAESNGEIRSATITPNDDGKIKKLSNKTKPKLLELLYLETDNFWDKWYNKALGIYRNN